MTELCIHCHAAPKDLPRHRCKQCLELRLPMDEQVLLALQRRFTAEENQQAFEIRPAYEWPGGQRWCAGCYSFRRFDVGSLKLDVAPGATRCRPCQTSDRRRHGYGMTREMDEALGTRCNICGNRQNFQALASDHNHVNGRLRGKLCYRCNHLVLGGGADSLAFFESVVDYLKDPPAERILRKLDESLDTVTDPG